MNTIICQQCGSLNEEAATKCKSCHSVLAVHCDACGKWNPFLLNYCQHCGATLNKIFSTDQMSGDAERRHLTVMFCDLVGSTSLSETLDPEELREIVVAYQDMCAMAIEEEEGYIAQYLGDGILIYFGYPKTHEDESQRAVKSALKIIDNINELNNNFIKSGKSQIAVRIGIHSGLVVIGDIGRGAKRERLALGETPNIAARIQSLAEPGTVLISAETFKMIQKHFYCHRNGTHTLKGITVPVTVYQPVAALESKGFYQQEFTGSPKLIGREVFTARLSSLWKKTLDGFEEVALIKGEAGIGKTHLMNDFISSVTKDARKLIFRCASHLQNNAFAPFIQILSSLAEINEDENEAEKLLALENFLSSLDFNTGESVPIFASLLSIPLSEKYQPPSSSVRVIKEKTFTLLKKLLYTLCEVTPVILVLDDLQWADPSTLELIKRLLDERSKHRLLYLFSYRAEFRPLFASPSLTEIELPNLSHEQTKELAEHIAGDKKLPGELLEVIIKKTDGVPLFVEELVRLILESGVLREYDDRYDLIGSLPELSIPPTLQDLLVAKLDQLGKAREIAQLGAVFGRDFTADVMEVISSLDFNTLSDYLKSLVEESLLIIKGEPPYFIFSFKHALVQEKAYQLLLKSKRQQYHLMIAEALEKNFPDFVKASPEFIAHHFSLGAKYLPAIQYWQKAGAQALSKSAYPEAIVFFNKGISLLTHLHDDEEKNAQEFFLLSGLAPALLTTRGYTDPSVEAAYARAYELMNQLRDLPQLSSLLRGLWSHYTVKANHKLAFNIAKRLNRIAERANDMLIEFEACKALGGSFFWRGEFLKAKNQLSSSLKKFDPEIYYRHLFLYSEHPVVSSLTYQSFNSWMLGDTEEALLSSKLAVDYARKLNHPFTLVYATGFAAVMYQFKRDTIQTAVYAKETLELATRHGFPFWLNMGNVLYYWSVTENNPGEGLEKMEQAMQAMRDAGVELWISNALAVIAETYGKINQAEQGLNLIEETFRLSEKNEEKFYLAELYRIKGFLLQQSGNQVREAEKYFKKALTVSEKQEARNFELRAAVNLALLWHTEENHEAARQLLESKLKLFSDRENTADLNEARNALKKILTEITLAK